MFTGMVKEVGKLNKITRVTTGLAIEIGSLLLTRDMKNGDSIAVNGCCLTVNNFIAGKSFSADVSFSTLKTTTFDSLRSGSYVNLEDALKFNDKLGGHMVSGHIDCKGKINRILKKGDFYHLEIKIPKDIAAFAAPKGSLSVDGVSLSIYNSLDMIISFAIIPFTFENTNLKYKKQGEDVNLEVDLMARYISNIYKSSPEIQNKKNGDLGLKEKLEKYGFK